MLRSSFQIQSGGQIKKKKTTKSWKKNNQILYPECQPDSERIQDGFGWSEGKTGRKHTHT